MRIELDHAISNTNKSTLKKLIDQNWTVHQLWVHKIRDHNTQGFMYKKLILQEVNTTFSLPSYNCHLISSSAVKIKWGADVTASTLDFKRDLTCRYFSGEKKARES